MNIRLPRVVAAFLVGAALALSGASYQGDGNKAIFYYIADERVDFRQLIKDLAASCRAPICFISIRTWKAAASALAIDIASPVSGRLDHFFLGVLGFGSGLGSGVGVGVGVIGVPANAMWLVRALLSDDSEFQQCLEREMPEEWLHYLRSPAGD